MEGDLGTKADNFDDANFFNQSRFLMFQDYLSTWMGEGEIPNSHLLILEAHSAATWPHGNNQPVIRLPIATVPTLV